MENAMAPTTLKALEYWRETLIENERLRSCLEDCVALLRGDLSGRAQWSGVMGEAVRLLMCGDVRQRGCGQRTHGNQTDLRQLRSRDRIANSRLCIDN
jgi:hypothetical protein